MYTGDGMEYRIKEVIKVRRSIGSRGWRLLSRLPMFIRGPVVRRMFKLDLNLPSDIVFKQAESPEEVQQAMALAFQAYYQRGLVPDLKSKMRATKFHLLPTTSILICKKKDKVIATMSVIVDSGLGLPIEELWRIDSLRKSSLRLAEISTLAIHQEHRSQRGPLLLALCGFMYRHCLVSLGVDRIVASFHPEAQDFYRCVLLFKEIGDGKVAEYDSVQGAAAVGGTLNLAEFDKVFKKAYDGLPANKNIFTYYTGPAPKNYIFNQEQNNICSKFVFTPPVLEEIFKDKTEVTSKLSKKEAMVVAETLFYPEFRSLLGPLDEKMKRSVPRFAVSLDGTINGIDMLDEKAKILEVSRYGLKICVRDVRQHLENGQTVLVKIQLPGELETIVPGEIVWTSQSNNQIGVILSSFRPRVWREFMDGMEHRLQRMRLRSSFQKAA